MSDYRILQTVLSTAQGSIDSVTAAINAALFWGISWSSSANHSLEDKAHQMTCVYWLYSFSSEADGPGQHLQWTPEPNSSQQILQAFGILRRCLKGTFKFQQMNSCALPEYPEQCPVLWIPSRTVRSNQFWNHSEHVSSREVENVKCLETDHGQRIMRTLGHKLRKYLVLN